MSKISAQRRFDALYVPEPNSGCWLWDGSVDYNGYGKFRSEGRILTASRASWWLHRGDIPSGLWVLHKCDNSICVNPDHLYLGGRTENMQDAVRRGRMARLQSILTVSDVGEIRRLLADGETQRRIASRFGVTTYTIRNIKSGRTWASGSAEVQS